MQSFSRQPRVLPDIPSGTRRVQDPPSAQTKPEISWFTVLVPPMVMLVITVLIALSMNSMFMMLSIAMTIMTLITSVMNAITQINRFKKRKKLREEKYLQYIKDMRSELSLIKGQQVNAAEQLHPTPDACIRRIESTDRQLFEKTEVFNDFLTARIGRGNLPLAVTIDYQQQAIQLEEDPLANEPTILATEFKETQDVTIALDFKEGGICGLTGEPNLISDMINTILLQLVTNHGYDDLRVVLLTDEKNLKARMWLRFAPHIWNDGHSTRFLCCGKSMTHQVLTELHQELVDRERNEHGRSLKPRYIFIIEDETLLEGELINRFLYNDSSHLGVYALFTAVTQSYLPMNCKAFINMGNKKGILFNKMTGFKTNVVPDELDKSKLERAGLLLAALEIKSSEGVYELPESITLTEMYQIDKVEALNLMRRWETNRTYYGISVPIGAKAGGKDFNLDLHETGHGPHGLVAGTTGSGKSELLQSIIISLSMNFHPHDLAFILIDYKGGGMADVFKGMPHLVGTITNLGGNETTRALLSIKSEIQQRQKIFSDYQVNNIDKYQKLYYSGTKANMPIVPHLVMIADEFAELKQDQPEFMKELVSAARVGRSLGIHLILATQKPAGIVDDQIWSNSKFKICLKVQDEADSNDVIKKPDAARLKRPGRAYIQVGNDEIFELFQSAYSGADYLPDGTQKKKKEIKRIHQLSLNGKREKLYPPYEEKSSNREVKSQLEAMVAHIIRTQLDHQIPDIEGPWKPPLEEGMALEGLLGGPMISVGDNSGLSIPLGLTDDPRQQRQDVYIYDVMRDDNMIIYGASGTGKSHILSVIALSASLRYGPESLIIYPMDMGGGSLRKLEQLPLCPGVINLEEEDKISHLLFKLEDLKEQRKKLFADSKTDGIEDYQAKIGRLPYYMVMIDNYYALAELYEDFEERFLTLMREGLRFGIVHVVTCPSPSLVRYRTIVNFKTALTMPLIDDSEYLDVVGRTEGLTPSEAIGRGLAKKDYPVELQISDLVYDNLTYEQLTERLEEHYLSNGYQVVERMPEMETVLPIAKLNSMIDMSATEGFAVGRSFNSLKDVIVDPSKHFTITIAGDREKTKYSIMKGWFHQMQQMPYYKDASYLVVDSKDLDLFEISSLDACVDVTDDEANERYILDLKDQMEQRRSAMREARAQRQDVNALMNQWSPVVLMMADFTKYTNETHYVMMDFFEHCIQEYRGLKLQIFVMDTVNELSSNYSTEVKAIKDEGYGLLLGSGKDQSVFDIKVPYSYKEKIELPYDGYLIDGGDLQSIRFAIDCR